MNTKPKEIDYTKLSDGSGDYAPYGPTTKTPYKVTNKSPDTQPQINYTNPSLNSFGTPVFSSNQFYTSPPQYGYQPVGYGPQPTISTTTQPLSTGYAGNKVYPTFEQPPIINTTFPTAKYTSETPIETTFNGFTMPNKPQTATVKKSTKKNYYTQKISSTIPIDRTPIFGAKETDLVEFDDYFEKHADKFFTPEIDEIFFYFTKEYLVGLQFFYRDSWGKEEREIYKGGRHMSKSESLKNYLWSSMKLEFDEYIKEIYVEGDGYVNYLKVASNKGRVIECGTPSGYELKNIIPNLSKCIGVGGSYGDLVLPNRMVMASCSRLRCDPTTGVPNELLVKYYSDRASAGLILTEGVPICKAGNPALGAGCIWSEDQIAGWKKITEAVHKKGGRIFIQLWHAGRHVNPEKSGEPNIGPSPIPMKAYDKDGNEVIGPMPKEMDERDIKLVLGLYKQAALNAKEAGFDGAELHCSTGQLPDQFLRSESNQRTDSYGGSAENRCRFVLEAMENIAEVFGASRVGIKVSPVSRFRYMFDKNPIETYTYLFQELDKRGVAYIQLMEANEESKGKMHFPHGREQIPYVCKQFRSVFKGTIIANGGFTPETALQIIREGDADLVSFGKLFIANPDLVERIKNNWPFNKLDPTTFYSGGEKGFIDYPFYGAETQEKLPE